MPTFDVTPVIVAFITVVGGSLVGLAALRKAGSEASKASAEATDAIVGSAGGMVRLMREEVDQLLSREDALEERIRRLEQMVESWESWADRVLALLDHSFKLLGDDQQAGLAEALDEVKSSRPRTHHERREH